MSAFADQVSFVVPVRAIVAGEVILPQLLTSKDFFISPEGAARYVLNPSQLEGKVARHLLLAGKPIMLSSVGQPMLVHRGKAVALFFRTGGLEITATGIPLESACVGDMVKVRNGDSGRVVSGVVMPDGRVRVGSR